jgi:hypothetical protein
MKILIQDLAEKFLPTILNNGLAYWKKDKFEIVEDSQAILKAIVFGTDEYQTEIHLSNNFITDLNCTCPYDKSLFCKHVAILYYEKFKDELGLKKAASRKPKTTKSVKKQYQTDIFSKVEKASREELKKIIVSRLHSDENFKQFLIHYFESNDENPLLLYQSTKDTIKEIFKRNKKHRDYIDYSDSNKIGRLICEISDKARSFFDSENYLQAFSICKAVIETMIKPLLYTDTSSGIFYQGLEECIEILAMMSLKTMPDDYRKEISCFLLKESKNKDNSGFGYEIKLLQLAIDFSNNTDKDLIIETINFLIRSNGYSEEFALLRYEVILKFEGEDIANQLLHEKII